MELQVTTHPPLCATQITSIPISLISSTIVTFVLKGHAAVSELRRLRLVFYGYFFLRLPNEGPFEEDPPRRRSLMKHLRSRNPDATTPPPFVLVHLEHLIPSVFPAARRAACHPQPHQTASVRVFFSPRTNTRQLMRGCANTTLFSSSSFMHREIMRLLSERAALQRLIHSGAAALKSLVKQMKTSCSIAPLMGLRQLRNCKRSVRRREEFPFNQRWRLLDNWDNSTFHSPTSEA